MALALKLIEVSGATRCCLWTSNKDNNKLSYSPSISEWLADSIIYTKDTKGIAQER